MSWDTVAGKLTHIRQKLLQPKEQRKSYLLFSHFAFLTSINVMHVSSFYTECLSPLRWASNIAALQQPLSSLLHPAKKDLMSQIVGAFSRQESCGGSGKLGSGDRPPSDPLPWVLSDHFTYQRIPAEGKETTTAASHFDLLWYPQIDIGR